MEKWPLGVFAGIDAGLGVHLDVAHELGVPHDRTDRLRAEGVEVTRRLCNHCSAQGQRLHLETGQETADTLLEFLEDVGYDGPLTIEREIPQEPARQKDEIGRGIRLLNELKSKIL